MKKYFDRIMLYCTVLYYTVHFCCRETGGYIAQMVFLPLYTMYLAIAARLYQVVSDLAMHHFKRLEVLRSSLKVCHCLCNLLYSTVSCLIPYIGYLPNGMIYVLYIYICMNTHMHV